MTPEEQVGEVWEALPDDITDVYDNPGEAVKYTLQDRDNRIEALQYQLDQAKKCVADLDRAMGPLMAQVTTIEADIAAARTDGYRVGYHATLDHIAAAIEESADHETFMRGVVATLRTSRTWARRS